MKKFTFHNPGKLVFGPDAARNVGKELAALEVERPVLITDETMAGSRGVEGVRTALGDALVSQFTEVVPDTGFEIIDEAAEIAREALENPALVQNAPQASPVGRVDETKAARDLDLRFCACP